jgi:hypothetical protein
MWSIIVGNVTCYTFPENLKAFQWELPQKVYGYVNKRGPNDCILDFHGMLHFANNKVAHFEGSFDTAFEQSIQISSKSQSIAIGNSITESH